MKKTSRPPESAAARGLWTVRRFRFVFCLSILCALLAAGFPAPSAAFEQDVPRLRKIVIEGLDPEREKTARALLNYSPGVPMRHYGLEEVRKTLTDAGLPPSRVGLIPVPYPERVDPMSGTPVDLVVDFRPPFRVDSVRLFTLVPVPPELLESELLLKPGDPYDASKVRASLEALTAKAEKLGHEKVLATPLETLTSTSTLDLDFIVESTAQPVFLRRFRFTGSGIFDLFNRGQLVGVLQNLKPVPFDKGTTLTAERLLETHEIARAFYQDKGWLDVDVRLDKVELTRKGAKVEYRVERGGRYEFAETRVENSRLPTEKFEAIAADYSGKNFTGKRRDEMIERLENHCKTHGFMAPTVELGYKQRNADEKVDILARVDEGTTSVLRSVELIRHPLKIPHRNPDGRFTRFRNWMSPSVEDGVILRQVRTQAGEPLDLWSIQNPTVRLNSFGCLEDVKVDTRATSNTFERDIVIDTTDKRSGAYGLSLGWAVERGPTGALQLRDSNIGGRADRLAFQVEASQEDFMGTISYLDRNWRLGERLLGAEREPMLEHMLYYGESWFSEYTQRVLGAAWELHYSRLNPRARWRDAWLLRLENVEIEPRRDPDRYEERFTDYVVSTLAYRLYRDTRDRGDLSTRGSYVGTALEMGHADGFLLKSTSSAEWYYTVLKRLTWATRAELGLMPYEAKDLPIGERYQAGGMGDIRGFRGRGIGPVDGRIMSLHTGGATKTLLSNELRLAVTKDIIPLVFCDVGTLDEEPLSFRYWNASAGLGLHFLVPGSNTEAFFFYSWRLKERDTDDTEDFQFGVRFALR
jgi:outer membrane protein insertion porin family